MARHHQLSPEAAQWKSVQVNKEQQENPKGVDDQIERARHKALLYFSRLTVHRNAVSQFTQGMSPEKAALFAELLDKKTLEYLPGYDAPGFADPTEPDSIRPDPTSFSAKAPQTKLPFQVAGEIVT